MVETAMAIVCVCSATSLYWILERFERRRERMHADFLAALYRDSERIEELLREAREIRKAKEATDA